MVQSLCGHWLVSVDPVLGELAGREITVGRVWPVQVVVDPPVLDEHLGLEQGVEAPRVEQLVAQPPVERLDPGVLPGGSRVDEDRADVVEAHETRNAAFDDQAVQGGHHPVGVDGALGHDGRTLAGELVNDVEQFDGAVVLGGVELEIERPQGVGGDGTHGTHAGPDATQRLLALAIRHSQALFAPKTLDPLVVDVAALAAQRLGRPPPAPARSFLGKGAQEGPECLFVLGWRRDAQALGGAMLADHRTCFSFGDPEPLAQHLHCCPATVRGQKFPSASSLSIALSSSASARSFFSRPFSASSSFKRLASFAFMPPYWASQRCQVDSAIWRCQQTSSSSAPPAKSLLPSASLRMIWSGVCLRRVAMWWVLLRSSLEHRTRTSSGPLQGVHLSGARRSAC